MFSQRYLGPPPNVDRCEKNEPIVQGFSDLKATDPEIDVPCNELTDEQKAELASIIREQVFDDAKGDGFDFQLEDIDVNINGPAPHPTEVLVKVNCNALDYYKLHNFVVSSPALYHV